MRRRSLRIRKPPFYPLNYEDKCLITRDRGTKLGRPRTLDSRRADIATLMKRGLSGRKIASKLKIPAGSVFGVMRAVDRNAA